MTSRQAMARLRFHWGPYGFIVKGGTYTAVAKFGSHDILIAEDPEDLLAQIRRHYGSDTTVERCST
jgi:hypothetical protein